MVRSRSYLNLLCSCLIKDSKGRTLSGRFVSHDGCHLFTTLLAPPLPLLPSSQYEGTGDERDEEEKNKEELTSLMRRGVIRWR